MNTSSRQAPIRTALVSIMLAASLVGTAFAGEPGEISAAESVGRGIANQGNAALKEIREDMRRDLRESLRDQAAPLPQLRAAPQPVQEPNRVSA